MVMGLFGRVVVEGAFMLQVKAGMAATVCFQASCTALHAMRQLFNN